MIKEYYNKIASIYEQKYNTPAMNYMRDVELSILLAHLPKNARILDIGCGPGTHLIPLRKEGFWVDGLDISERMIEILKAKLKNDRVTKLYVSDIESFFTETKYSGAYSMFGVLNHVKNVHRALENINNLLETGGVFVLSVANHLSIFRIKERDTYTLVLPREEERFVEEVGMNLWFRYYSKRELLELLRKHGFSVEKVGGIFFFVRPKYHESVKHVDEKLKEYENKLRWMFPTNEFAEYLVFVCRKKSRKSKSVDQS